MTEWNSAEENQSGTAAPLVTTPTLGVTHGVGALEAAEDQARYDRGERDKAYAERDRAREELAEFKRKVEGYAAENAELHRKYDSVHTGHDAELKRQHEIAKDLRARLDYAEQQMAGAPAPEVKDQTSARAQQVKDAEQEHRDRDKHGQQEQNAALQAAEADKALQADQERQEYAREQVAQGDGLHVPDTSADQPAEQPEPEPSKSSKRPKKWL